jgi:hypothetical protein
MAVQEDDGTPVLIHSTTQGAILPSPSTH